jgi:hypothetical protein
LLSKRDPIVKQKKEFFAELTPEGEKLDYTETKPTKQKEMNTKFEKLLSLVIN